MRASDEHIRGHIHVSWQRISSLSFIHRPANFAPTWHPSYDREFIIFALCRAIPPYIFGRESKFAEQSSRYARNSGIAKLVINQP